MLWSRTDNNYPTVLRHASAAEIVQCFRHQSLLLGKLAILITTDQAAAEECIVEACDRTLRGNTPFRDWLLEWTKVATITSAVSRTAEAIRGCEATHMTRRCTHPEHLSLIDAATREADLNFVLQCDPQEVPAQLDPLCRAVLVLRLATQSSFHDCVLRVNISRAAVLAANCLAMTWLRDVRSASAEADLCGAAPILERAEAHDRI